MGTLSCTIGGNAVTVKDQSFKIDSTLEVRGILTLTVIDSIGTATYAPRTPITLSDSVLGVLYNGYVGSDKPKKLGPASATVEHVLTCFDKQYLLDKQANKQNYLNWQAGDIVVDMVNRTLAAEGVTIPAALHHDSTQADFSTGVLSGVIGTTNLSGDLELTPAGANVVISEVTQADFSTGTLANTAPLQGGGLTPTLTPAIQYTTTGFGTITAVIWTGAQLIGSNDTLRYDTWGPTPGTVRFLTSDGSDSINNPGTDTTVNGGITWWSRVIALPSAWNGKTITQVEISFNPNATTLYTTYFRNIRLQSAPGNPFFSTTIQKNPPIIGHTQGGSTFTATVVPTCNPGVTSLRISPAYSVASAVLLRTSLVSYTTILPTNTDFRLIVSSDNGATWEPVTNGAPLPFLLAGMNLTGSLQFQEIFTTTATDPTIYPILQNLNITIYSASQGVKTDAQYTAYSNTDWSAGTLANITVANNRMAITTYQAAISGVGTNNIYSSGAMYYTVKGVAVGPNSSSIDSTVTNLGINTQTSSPITTGHSHFRFTNGGSYTTMTYNSTLTIYATENNGQIGPTYLTPQWNTIAGTFGYCALITGGISASLQLLRGSAGGSTTVLAGPVTLTTPQGGGINNTAVTFQIIYNAGNHKIYVLNSVTGNYDLIFNVNDSTYTAAANIGCYTNFTSGNFSPICNFSGVQVSPTITNSGSFVSPSTSLTPVGTYGNSQVVWTEQDSTTLLQNFTVEISTDGGATFAFATNNSPIPGLTAGASLSGKSLVVRITLYNPFITKISTITGLRVLVIGQYSASGTRSTMPMGNDTMVRANVSSGFGTSFDSQTYAQIGTGTTALTSNKATITNTTGDVRMLLGSRTWTDEDATVHFLLSVATINAGIVLRYADANNFYQLQASTSTASIVKVRAGVTSTIATTAISPALAINTPYRMRFRIVGANTATITARVWQDGTLEPTTWQLTVHG